MSKVAIKGADTGTGVFTLESPATNTDRTLVLPDEAGTVLTSVSSITQNSGPAFSAYASAGQSVAHSTWTKLQLNTEEYDTDSCYDSSTYRFTPTVAGYYQVTGKATIANTGSNVYCVIRIYKNGSVNYTGQSGIATSSNYANSILSNIVYMNGSTDYIELYVLHNYGSSQNTQGGIDTTLFQACLVRAA
jgi:hypothetical protein